MHGWGAIACRGWGTHVVPYIPHPPMLALAQLGRQAAPPMPAHPPWEGGEGGAGATFEGGGLRIYTPWWVLRGLPGGGRL